MKNLSPAEEAVLRAWNEYVRSHEPNCNHRDEYDNDTIDRTRLFYLMTEILYEYYQEKNLQWFSYLALRMMNVDSGTFSRWRRKWQKIWLNLRLK
jgi:hypothetical protein